MPHITIKCYPGRTEEQKKKCAESVALAIANTLGCDISAVSLKGTKAISLCPFYLFHMFLNISLSSP